MNANPSKNCLLIIPRTFYSFSKMFRTALESLGYDVIEANEEYPENALGKIMGKLDLEIVRKTTRRVVNKRFLQGKSYDLVVIIKGRGVGKQLVQDLKRHARKLVWYHFDALAYDRATARWSEGMDRISTFDYRDAEERGWPLVELFSAQPPLEQNLPIQIGFSAILRNHSNRLAYLDAVTRALDLKPDDGFFYIFEQNTFSLARNFLRHPSLYWRWRKKIHRSPLPYDEYRRVLATSDFTIDYAHDKQSGLTMRSFEALAVGAKLITNNPNIVRSSHFQTIHAIVFERNGDPALLKREVMKRQSERPPIKWRSVTDCVLEILGERIPPQGV